MGIIVVEAIPATHQLEGAHRLEINYIYNVPPADGIHVNEISDERELTKSIRQQTCISLRDAEFKRLWDMLRARHAELQG